MKQADEERFSALLAWATTHGGRLHPAVEVYKDDVTGFSMRLKPTLRSEPAHAGLINPQDEILTCPATISLSYLNALTDGPLLSTTCHESTAHASSAKSDSSGPAFPPEFMALPPHIISRFFLIKQYLLGKSSFWYPYIATLPQPDQLASWNLPPFWPQEDAAFLEDTNTGIAAAEIHDAVKAEYKQARRILKSAGLENYQDYTASLHTWAYSMFASRSFRPSLVIPKEAVWKAADIPEEVQLDDFSILLPVFDIINHSMQAQVRWLVDNGNTPDTTTACCRFQTFDSYTQPGQQIFNSYGTKTNSELLLSYGFVLPETEALHNDYIHLRKKASAQTTTTATTTTHQPGQNWGPSNNKPQDFLVSLRPMNHPSSLAGLRRQLVAKDPNVAIRPEFAHVEDALVWDLCLMVIGGEANKSSFISTILSGTQPSVTSTEPPTRDQEELECLRRILSPSTSTSTSEALPPQVTQVLAHVKDILLGKLGQEYDKLCEADPGIVGVDEDGNELVVEVDPQTSNQALALAYRGQAKKVLENAIAALVPDWQAGAGDD